MPAEEPNVVACYICKLALAQPEGGIDERGRLIFQMTCIQCGKYRGLLDTVAADLGDPANAGLMPYLAAHIRQANDQGERVVELTTDNWRTFAEAHASTSIERKLELLLRFCARASPQLGATVALSPYLHPLVDAKNSPEVGFLAWTLAQEGLLDPLDPTRPVARVQVTAKGWGRLAPWARARSLARASSRCRSTRH